MENRGHKNWHYVYKGGSLERPEKGGHQSGTYPYTYNMWVLPLGHGWTNMTFLCSWAFRSRLFFFVVSNLCMLNITGHALSRACAFITMNIIFYCLIFSVVDVFNKVPLLTVSLSRYTSGGPKLRPACWNCQNKSKKYSIISDNYRGFSCDVISSKFCKSSYPWPPCWFPFARYWKT